MKKVIFAIFAHPDDEAFGPASALLIESKAGNDVHLITLTSGQAGTNPDNVTDLGIVREKEWRTAGALLGTRSMHTLGYVDGELCNAQMIEIVEKIQHIVTEISKDARDVEIEFMTNDLNGITGHIDHIVAARAACHAFYQLKQQDQRLTRIRLACLPLSQFPTANINWIYMEAGRDDSEIDEIIDARNYRDEIIAIMRCHNSQRADLKNHLDARGDLIGLDYFMIKT